MAAYAAERRDLRRDLVAKKKFRRQDVGPVCTFYFENYDTMWAQVHEMLYIEKGGEEQIEDELRAYNPLIPQGRELIATVMFEIDDPRSEEHTSELQSLMRNSYAVFCLKKKNITPHQLTTLTNMQIH